MGQTYCFEFQGTREEFLKQLNQYPNNDHRFFYFDDYIVEVSNDNYFFGVQRGGHSGGYWFKPNIIESTDKLQFSGEIESISFHTNKGRTRKVANRIYEGCLFVVLLPLFLGVKLYTVIKSLIKRIKKQPIVKVDTTEDRLIYLMEDLLNCTRK